MFTLVSQLLQEFLQIRVVIVIPMLASYMPIVAIFLKNEFSLPYEKQVKIS